MQISLRQKRLREQRSAFLAFMVLALVYLLAGLPIVYRSLATNAAPAAEYHAAANKPARTP